MIGDRIDNDIMPAKKNGNANNMDKNKGFGGYWQITGDDEKPDYIVKNIIEICSCL